MSTVTASRLLDVWSFRLKMDDHQGRTWAPELRVSVEGLVSRLRSVPGDSEITIDADEERTSIIRFILTSTGEIVGAIDKPAGSTPIDI